MDTAKRTQILETPNVILNPYRYAGGTAFSPDDIAGLTHWYDPSDSSTLFDADTGGSTPSDGGAVGRIEDKAGAINLTQATAGNRPLYRASGINGIGSIDCVSSDYFDHSSIAVTDFTLFFVCTRTASGKNSFPFGTSGSFYPVYWFTDDKIYSAPTSFTGSFSSAADTSTGDFTLTVTRSGTSGEIWLNGTSKATGSPASGSTNWTTMARRNTNYHNDEFGELLVYNSALSTTDLNSVHSYLSSKWGMTIATI